MMAVEELSLRGKRCLLTGASSGIGRQAARIFARLGAELLALARDPVKGAALLEELARELPAGTPPPRLELADLSSLRETAALAERVLARGPLDLLVNCAGTYQTRRRLSPEGLELQFAVNHLAPFLLTTRLLPALAAAPAARVITVSSGSHYYGRIHWRDPSLRSCYLGLWAYEQSKLANVLFSAELVRRLGPDSRITVFTADPGLVNTEMGLKAGPSFSSLVWSLRRRAGTSPEQPARAIAFLSAAPELAGKTGRYWRDGVELLPSRRARDPEAARRLWELSEGLVEGALAAPLSAH